MERIKNSPFKKEISEYFDFSFDFDFLDIFAILLDRALANYDEQEEKDLFDAVNDAIGEGLIWTVDEWTVMKFYRTPQDANLADACDALREDIHNVAEKIINKEE